MRLDALRQSCPLVTLGYLNSLFLSKPVHIPLPPLSTTAYAPHGRNDPPHHGQHTSSPAEGPRGTGHWALDTPQLLLLLLLLLRSADQWKLDFFIRIRPFYDSNLEGSCQQCAGTVSRPR